MALQLVHFICTVRQDYSGTELFRTARAADAICLAAALLLCLLSPFEHLRTVRPSALLLTYLFFTILLDAVYVRTLWLTGYSTAPVATACIAAKAALLVAEAPSKRWSLTAEHAARGREELSGIFSKTLFLWLLELLRLGNGKVLSLQDLYPLEDELLTGTLVARFDKSWKEGMLCQTSRRVLGTTNTRRPC